MQLLNLTWRHNVIIAKDLEHKLDEPLEGGSYSTGVGTMR
jgi:hypothetical protein